MPGAPTTPAGAPHYREVPMVDERKRLVGNWKVWAIVLLAIFALWHLANILLAGGSAT